VRDRANRGPGPTHGERPGLRLPRQGSRRYPGEDRAGKARRRPGRDPHEDHRDGCLGDDTDLRFGRRHAGRDPPDVWARAKGTHEV